MRAVKHIILPLALCAFTAACGTVETVTRADPALQRFSSQDGPPNAAPGSCWGKDVTPAVLETVTDNILLHPAEIGSDGMVRREAVYKTETRQAIVRERREIWFETPCEAALTTEFVASVQRALTARGVYSGDITGEMDARTLRAVRAYQAPQGLDSAILSIAAARKLGLVAVPREDG
ncbi:MAG: peptidoglycan-binding domain-containing protein [Pseudomonadota bacterium]